MILFLFTCGVALPLPSPAGWPGLGLNTSTVQGHTGYLAGKSHTARLLVVACLRQNLHTIQHVVGNSETAMR